MRAARALDMLLVLQRRGRMTARDLAERLEVTQRTILRDVEVLSEAGVPIFTVRGAGGGIELMDGFQTHLTGLTTDEAQCLLLVGQPQVAHRLGLGAPTRTARDKLMIAIAPELAEEADRLSEWFLHDPDPWTGNRIPHGELRRIARAIQRRRKIEITIADRPTIVVRPLGLALKEGSWNLVTAVDDGVEVACIDQLRATRLTNQVFTPPGDFDLAAYWRLHVIRAAGKRREPPRPRPRAELRSTSRRRRAATPDADRSALQRPEPRRVVIDPPRSGS